MKRFESIMESVVMLSEMLAQSSGLLVLRALHERERSEAIQEKHCLYKEEM